MPSTVVAGGPAAGVTWHAVDLRDPTQASALITKIRPTHLLHGAWIATPGLYSHSPENVTWLQSTIALATAFGAHGGARFVGIGSSAEYDPSDRPCVEDQTPIRPATIYGKPGGGQIGANVITGIVNFDRIGADQPEQRASRSTRHLIGKSFQDHVQIVFDPGRVSAVAFEKGASGKFSFGKTI